MFLNNFGFYYREISRIVSVVCVLCIVCQCACGFQSSACYIDMPVYDATGNRLDFKISRVTPEGFETNLLTSSQADFRVANEGSRLYFPKKLIGMRMIEVTLANETGQSVVCHTRLLSCQQRVSIEEGMVDKGLDVSGSTLTGHLTGCSFFGDWWVQLVPMFGGTEYPQIHEGLVRSADGFFNITSNFRGERHILVVGKGKDTVRVVGVNLVSGSDNDAGRIDLTGSCPK
jgi:hypothetical protein